MADANASAAAKISHTTNERREVLSKMTGLEDVKSVEMVATDAPLGAAASNQTVTEAPASGNQGTGKHGNGAGAVSVKEQEENAIVLEKPVATYAGSRAPSTAAAPPNNLVQPYCVGVAGGTMYPYSYLTYDQMMNNQYYVDLGWIIAYPYFSPEDGGCTYLAGHNPGAMSGLSGIDYGSVIAITDGTGEYHYQVVAIESRPDGYSDAGIYGYDDWQLVSGGGCESLLIQFCVDDVNTWYFCLPC